MNSVIYNIINTSLLKKYGNIANGIDLRGPIAVIVFVCSDSIETVAYDINDNLINETRKN